MAIISFSSSTGFKYSRVHAPQVGTNILDNQLQMYAGRIEHKSTMREHDYRMAVVGLVEKSKGTGRMVAVTMKQPNSVNASALIRTFVKPGSVINTDESLVYKHVSLHYKHETVNHARHEYARGNVSTNTIEGCWNLFRRSYRGTYTHMAAQHPGQYVAEHVYRYNNRQLQAGERFALWFENSERQLGYIDLTSRG